MAKLTLQKNGETSLLILINLATAMQNRTAFPEEDCFLIQGGQRKEAVTTGAALPFIKEYLAKI